MENRNFYNEILTEHNMHPDFKHDIEDADIVLDGINPSCVLFGIVKSKACPHC